MNIFKHVQECDLLEIKGYLQMYVDSVNDHCIDNYRIFPADMRDEYDDIAFRGCCGSFDTKHTTESGNVYLIGFNYGH